VGFASTICILASNESFRLFLAQNLITSTETGFGFKSACLLACARLKIFTAKITKNGSGGTLTRVCVWIQAWIQGDLFALRNFFQKL